MVVHLHLKGNYTLISFGGPPEGGLWCQEWRGQKKVRGEDHSPHLPPCPVMACAVVFCVMLCTTVFYGVWYAVLWYRMVTQPYLESQHPHIWPLIQHCSTAVWLILPASTLSTHNWLFWHLALSADWFCLGVLSLLLPAYTLLAVEEAAILGYLHQIVGFTTQVWRSQLETTCLLDKHRHLFLHFLCASFYFVVPGNFCSRAILVLLSLHLEVPE